MSRTTSSTITPAVPMIPIVPATPNHATTPSRSKKSAKQSGDAFPSVPTSAMPQPETPTRAARKTSAPKTPIAATPSKKAKEDATLQKKSRQREDEKKPASEAITKEPSKGKGKGKSTIASESTPQKEAGNSKSGAAASSPVAATTPATTTKRQPPGKLDITAATRTPESAGSPATSSNKVESQPKSARGVPTPATTSVPASPAAAATGSPIKRTVAPRTLRVIPTPKTEVPPPLPAGSAANLPQSSTVEKLRSRQASIASVNLPGTPERKRHIEEEMAIEETKSDVEVVQAPIIGRKKKAKKPASNPKIPTAVPKPQPASPKPTTVEDDPSEVPSVAAKTAQSTKTPTPDPEPIPEPRDKRDHSAQSIMADLQRTGELLASTLEFFKPLSSSLTHASRAAPSGSLSGPPDLKIHFSEAELEALAKKKPVRLTGHDGKPDSRTLITPNGKFFWGLSEELEEKALQLEKQIEELRGHARFHPRKHTTSHHAHSLGAQSQSKDVLPAIATALKEAGKKLGDKNTQHMPKLDADSMFNHQQQQQTDHDQAPPPPQSQTPADAGAYLNQFVLPKTDNPPPNQPRPEMAAVGGAPGAGTANISVNAGKFAKAAKAVVEGGAVGSTEIDGMGMMAADLLGGVFVQGLEALVGAGLGFTSKGEFGFDGTGNGNVSMRGGGGGGLDVQELMSAIEDSSGFSAAAAAAAAGGRYGRGSVMSLEEAERAMHAARKEHDVLEKKLAAIMKKNKKLFAGSGKG
ncbi:hypothetical protein FB567DRAFT_247240 [Paraphoma chrysanthemicola]|uniref:Uncharacterized protein n=1 Tax=Paraphoma chrysanthemicola TaxID=798071 RepID=A0A8K0VSE1_9PLEO|nr:hypothetical protein FB567DRAFT_247240 [Paraphoma chrysanthemicola]